MRHDWLACVVVRDRELEHSGQCEKRRSMHLSMCARPNMARVWQSSTHNNFCRPLSFGLLFVLGAMGFPRKVLL